MSKQDGQLNIAGKLGKVAMGSNLTPILSILILIIGVLALMVTPREENPQIDVPAANVIVHMQGASPEEIQNLVIRPLEMLLREMTGVDHTYGTSLNAMGIVTVMFKVGEDKGQSMVKLYDRVMQNIDRIPPGASQPMIKPADVDDVPVSVINLASEELDGLMLKRLAERVREQLAPLEGISVVDIVGGLDRSVRITIDPVRLAAYKIPLDSLHKVLSSANVGGPVGQLVSNNHVSRVWLDGYLQSASEVGRLLVGQMKEQPVYLRDVADIVDGSTELNSIHRMGFGKASDHVSQGEPEYNAISIALSKKRGTNAVFVTQRIENKLDELKGDFIPDNVLVTIARDSGKKANSAVNLLVEHLGIAIVSIIIIMLIFLGWREASIVTMNIPLILFIVLAVGFFADQTINRITLFALILALGLLVDDAIVVIENIHRHLHHGAKDLKDKANIIIRATNETGKPTIIATIAVIFAFIPMAFVTGMMGPYMGPIPFNVPIAMGASLIIAYMLTPWIALRWLPSSMPDKTMNEKDEDSNDWIHNLYMRLAVPLFDNKKQRQGFWVIVLVLFIASLLQPGWQFIRPAGINGPLTTGSVELKMLPKGDQNTFNITIDMPEGTPLRATDAVARDIAVILRQDEMIENYQTYIGKAGPIDFNGMLRGSVFRQGSHLANIRVNLVDKHSRSLKSEELVVDLRKKLQATLESHPEANVKLVEDPPGPPVRATLLAEIYGPNYEQQQLAAKHVREVFENTYDVVDIDDSLGEDQRELRIVLDKDKASRLGVATATVKSALRDFLSGYDIGAIHIESERHPVNINVRLPQKFRVHASDLDRIYLSSNQGVVQLSSIATVEESIVPKPLFTKDANPVVYVSAEPKQGSQVYSLLDMDQRLDNSEFADGQSIKTGGMRFTSTQPDNTYNYHLLWDGEMRLTLDVFRDLGAAFIVAIVLIYLLMVAYYGQFTLPILVIAPTALTMIGIFPGHWITGQPFTATSMIGVIALAGIVVRNSTLLVDFILDYRERGFSVRESVLEAGAARSRPILLTALAVVAGSAIMISDPVFGGLGVSMAFGTIAATILSLFVTPLMYYLWQRDADS